MKKLSICIFVFILLSSIGVIHFLFIKVSDKIGSQIVNFNNVKNKPKRDKSIDKRSGPEMEKRYLEQLHYPYDAVLKPELLNCILSEVKNAPHEKFVSSSVTNWMPIGPYGSVIPSTSTRFTGRILDINTRDTSNILIAAASGGLWAAGNPPVALTDMLTSQSVGSFDIQPGNSNVIVIGTGEPFMRAGTGMYISTNGGTNWSGINLNDTTPAGFYKVRYSSQNVIHAASTRGYYRSDNNGLSWQKYLIGDISDVAVHPVNNNVIYCSRRMHTDSDSGGVFKSTNNGLGWIRMTTGIPVTDVGRTSISIAKSNPSFVFVLMAKRNGDMMGIFRTAGADSWTNVSPPEDILGGIGWYTCEIAISPTTPSKVFAGGVWLWGTTNLGISWNKYDNNYDLNVHADQHAISWDSAGNSIWFGNDGGITFTDDEAFSFKTRKNNFSITQYYNVDVSLSSPGTFMGGSQDNGITSTTDNGSSWIYHISWGGDGSGAAISPFNPLERYMTIGVYGGNWPFRRHRTTNGGVNWIELNNGIDPSTQWFTNIKTDNVNPITVYTSSGEYLYSSTNKGDNWVKSNASGFADWISNFNVRKYNDTSVIYVNTISANSGQRIYVKEGTGIFFERSADISDGLKISTVALHPQSRNTAFAVISGLYSSHKVYKTTNTGINWVNITNDLPNVSAIDLTVYPYNDDIMYLGTEMGCYKTTNEGANWFRWNNGMPEANVISQLKPYFSGGEFYILAGTYGRGMWIRRDDDLLNITTNNEIPYNFELYQNYPNPFNPITKIKFSLPTQTNVLLLVYDISGKLVNTVLNRNMNRGNHEITFEGRNLASGVYFYQLKAKGFQQIKKMILIK